MVCAPGWLPASMRGSNRYLRMPTAVSSFGTHVLSLRRVLNFVGLLDSTAYVPVLVCHMHYIFHSFCYVHFVYYILSHGKKQASCALITIARALSRDPPPLPSTHTGAARPCLEPAIASSSSCHYRLAGDTRANTRRRLFRTSRVSPFSCRRDGGHRRSTSTPPTHRLLIRYSYLSRSTHYTPLAHAGLFVIPYYVKLNISALHTYSSSRVHAILTTLPTFPKRGPPPTSLARSTRLHGGYYPSSRRQLTSFTSPSGIDRLRRLTWRFFAVFSTSHYSLLSTFSTNPFTTF
jgi:hypothetical protein